jgi:hypothetical protein
MDEGLTRADVVRFGFISDPASSSQSKGIKRPLGSSPDRLVTELRPAEGPYAKGRLARFAQRPTGKSRWAGPQPASSSAQFHLTARKRPVRTS